MNNQKSSLDIFVWVGIIILLCVGIVANFYFASYALPIRIMGWLILAIILVFLALQTKIGNSSWRFVVQSRMEMRKVFWPSRQETIQTTVVVMGMVVLMALFLWGIDSILLWTIGRLTGQVG